MDELLSESAVGVKLMKEQARIFAEFWSTGTLFVTRNEIYDAADRMTTRYLKWLHQQAGKHSVDLKGKAGKAN